MASPARVERAITLEEFLRMPEIDEHPLPRVLRREDRAQGVSSGEA